MKRAKGAYLNRALSLVALLALFTTGPAAAQRSSPRPPRSPDYRTAHTFTPDPTGRYAVL
jgi:hypothetical protein